MTNDVLDPIDAPELTVDQLRQRARANRRAFALSSDSRFVKTMKTVMSDYLKARDEGVSREDGIKGIESALREVWPRKTSRFHAACGRCEDSGWRLMECAHRARCGRERCSWAEEAYAHHFVVHCDCEKGQQMQARALTQADELATVGRIKKRKTGGFSRLGQ